MEADAMEMDEMEALPRARSLSPGSNSSSSPGYNSESDGENLGLRSGFAVGASAARNRTQLFDRIMLECRHNLPGQAISAQLREEIEKLPPHERTELVSRQRHAVAPLFVAASRGLVLTAQYLVAACGAPLEQRGVYRAPNEATLHRVTPLWAAAVAGRLETVRALAEAGADVEARSDSGSTPLRSACFMSHVEVARYLLARGADVRRSNHNGGTCLVNAVQCEPLCRLLLEAGADVDAQDSQQKTALHYAIQEHREDTTRLLLAAGADPMLTTREGDDALQIACIKGAWRLVHSLSRTGRYPAARVADAYELLGATQLDEYNDSPGARASWSTATDIRYMSETGAVIAKRPVRGPLPALGGAREWTTQDELDANAHDQDWMRTQALLVVVRVLSPTHKDTLFRLMYRGAAYADAFRYSRCVALWTWVLELRIQKDTLLHPETCQTLLALTRLLLDSRAGAARPPPDRPRPALSAPHAALSVLRILIAALPESQRLVAVRPTCRAQCATFDRVLRCAAHLLHVLLTPQQHDAAADAEDGELDPAYKQEVSSLVSLELASCATGDTLLHLACSRLNVIRSTYFADEIAAPAPVFPSVGVARLLLRCGAAVSRRNRARCTPLHVAAIPYNFSTELVETLVSWGAHLDQPNRFGDAPADLVTRNPRSRVRPLRHVTLACRAARALLARCPDPHLDIKLPSTLKPFLELHRA